MTKGAHGLDWDCRRQVQYTEQDAEKERAEFECMVLAEGLAFRDRQHGVVFWDNTPKSIALKAWQAAIRAQVVSQGWKLAPMEPTPEQLLKVYKQTGVSRKDLADLWTAMLAAAPQPPEADLKRENPASKPEAAPVQLPEHVYTLRIRGRLHDHTPALPAFDLEDGEHKLYTEQQVRQLLEAKDRK